MKSETRRIRVEVRIDAPIEKVWRSFNDPDEILRWDAAPEWRTVAASNDLRVGGSIRLRIEPADGTPNFDHSAIYVEIVPDKLIEWRSDDGRHVRVEFKISGTAVIVIQTFDPAPLIPRDEQKADWQRVLDSFADHVHAHSD